MSKFNLKRSLPLFITSAALLVSLSSCGGDSQEISELRNQIEILQDEVEKKDNEIKSLETANEQLISQLENIGDLQEKNEETQNNGDSVSEEVPVDGLGNIDRKTAESLFYKDGQLVVTMSSAYYLKYYDNYYGGPDNDGYVKEIVKDGIKYLVDADDICNVLLCDYESISAPFYLKYYDSYYGGPDSYEGIGDGRGYVVEIVKHGVKYLVDANDFSQVLLCDYESLGNPFYLKYYDSYYGGPDSYGEGIGDARGYVVEIVKHGVKYLVDANDFSQVLLYNYEDVYCTENPGEIVVTYPDGMINTFYNDKNFKPHTDYVLSRSLKKR